MKRTLITILLLTVAAQGQQMSLPPQKALPQSMPGTVTLTLSEYNRLLDLAARKPKVPEAAPLPFVLSRAAFRLRVESESMVGALDIGGDVLQKGPTKVPLTTGLTIVEAQQSQKPLPLLQEGPAHVAVVNGPGAFSVSLSVASALTVDAGRASFTLPVPAATSAVLSLDIPGNHADAHVEPGLITGRTTSNGHTIVEATLEPGKPARVWWTTREVTAPVTQREVRFLSDIKTLISVGDSELRVAALCDINIIQGEPVELKMPLPAGFEVTEVSGSTLDSSETKSGELILKLRQGSRRAHQFLIAFERPSLENKLDSPFLAFAGAQGETGEVLVEGVGTMELTAAEGGGLRRIDVREAGPISRSLAHFPLQAAFRYHRRPGDPLSLTLEWNRFPDGPVLSAIAERATITTLLNAEGKSLTEVTLRVRNHAQPFMKVELPQGANLLSAEVEGEKVKPVQGSDGSRVPLLRAGFRPSGAYTVSFVYLSSGAPFAKSGSYEMSVAKLDLPISLVMWEVFLPDRLEVKRFDGNALSASFFPAKAQEVLANAGDDYNEMDQNIWAQNKLDLSGLEAGQIGGIVADPQGAVVAGATVTVINTQTGAAQTTTSDAEGRWVVSGVGPGPVRVKVGSRGFKDFQQEMDFDSSHPARLGVTLDGGAVSETVTVTGGRDASEREFRKLEDQARKAQDARMNAPSQNVFNLQRRVAGILPVRVDVPRAGNSYRFVRPLVLEEETKITFQYKSR
ncbi:MAG TPA: carboxypeptidase-like regulatory domain-containing protein [Blastocatellia bacterium]|nr:carboxypeptidase-like regulatory domain-containing protein [Blastocatellia bacterium]